MKKLIVLILCLFAAPALATNHYLCTSLTGGGSGALDALDITGASTPNVDNLSEGDSALVMTISGATVTSYHYIFDASGTGAESSPDVIRPDDYASAGTWLLVTEQSDGGTIVGNLNVDDGSGATPFIIFKDGSDETASFGKADGAYLGLSTEAADGLNILAGNLKVGNGTPGQTIDGEDAYVEGLLEVDGVIYADGNIDTGQGANELYDMDQNVLTTSSPTFVDLTVTSLTVAAKDNPAGYYDETDGTDWWTGVDDAGNSFEWRTNASVGTNVKMELTESGGLTLGDNSDVDISITMNSDTDDLTINWDEDNSEVEINAPNYRLGANADEDIVVVMDSNTNDLTVTWDEDNNKINIGSADLATTGAITGRMSRGADITANTNHDTTECHNVVYVFTAVATVTLDAAADAGYGSVVCYRVRDAEVATIDVDASEKINLEGTALAAGYTIDSSGAAGEFVCLMSTTDTDGSGTDGWETWGLKGTWSDGGAS